MGTSLFKETMRNLLAATTASLMLAASAAAMTRNMLAQDAAEGIDAFLEKRRPAWRGC